MPANQGGRQDHDERSPEQRRSTRREWSGLSAPSGFERCVRGTLRELYGYAALLVGSDRNEAERLVAEVYRSLFRAVRSGRVESVTLGALRSAARRSWLDEHREELVAVDEVSTRPASTIAELSGLERAVLVLLHVNGMSPERAAEELGRRERDVRAIGAHSVRRLRGTDDTSGAWLRAYLGPTVTPSPGMVDRIVSRLGDVLPPEPEARDESAAVLDDSNPVSVAVPSRSDSVDVLDPAVDELAVDEPVVDEPVVDEPAADEPDEPVVDEPAVDPAADEEDPAAGFGRDPHSAIDADDVPAAGAGTDLVVGADGFTEGVAPIDETRTGGSGVSDQEADAGRPAVVTPRVVPARPDQDVTVVPRAPNWLAFDEPAISVPDGEREFDRRFWVTAIAGVLVVAQVIALVWLVLSGEAAEVIESTRSVATTTVPAPTTTVDTSTDATTDTTDDLAAVASASAVTLGFDPPCGDSGPGADVPVYTWSDSFGPLGDEPVLTVVFPESVDLGSAEPRRASLGTVLLRPDGVVAVVRPADEHTADQALISRIGFDGTVVWSRCFDRAVEVRTEPGVDLAVRRGGDETWTALLLTDGSEVELDSVQEAVLAEPAEPSSGTSSSGDSSSGTSSSASPDGPSIGFIYDAGLGRSLLAVVDVDGDVLWRLSDLVLGAEFRAAVVGDAVLLQGCLPTDDGADCEAGSLQARDLTTGTVLWERPGLHHVPVTADGVALVSDGTTWDVVDVATGETLQTWDDPDRFPCCEAVFERSGGALIVVRPGVAEIWMGRDVDADPIAASIP